MQVVTNYPNGIFNWVDLTSSNQQAAKVFYSNLFGWETEDTPLPMGDVYTTFKLQGKNVAGCGQLGPEMQAMGVPSAWTSYVKHDNADAIAEKISAAGGTLVFPPMDVMEEGRMLMATDPTGATFGVWQPYNHIGAQLVNIPNTLVWNELQTRDSAAALTFYNAVFGWNGEPTGPEYTNFEQNGRRQAGMMQMNDSWDANMPANWSIYFAVNNAEATVAKAQELGGTILMPPTPAGDVGTFAVIQDPQGAIFSIIQMSIPADPPPGF